MDNVVVMLCDVDVDLPDGARTHTVEVARGFARAGFGVHLISRGSDPQIDGVRHDSAQGAEHARLPRLMSLNRLTARALVRHRRRARRFYVRHKWTTIPATVLARLLGYRVVTEVDDLPYGPSYAGEVPVIVDHFNRLMTILMGRISHGVVAGTPEVRRLLEREFHVPAERIGIVPIGVDIDYFHPLERQSAIARAGLDPQLRYLLFVGHFASWVDFDTLLAAFAQLVRTQPDVRLVLVGDGDARPRVESQLRELGIADEVIMTGHIRARERVRDLLGAAVAALAAHRGAHLNRIGMNATKLAEYLASGRAIVALDVAHLREMIEQPGAGLVVEHRPEEFAAALQRVLEPGVADAMGRIGRDLAEQHYSWQRTVERTLPLFGL